jgi:hypothetical protein
VFEGFLVEANSMNTSIPLQDLVFHYLTL